MSTLPLKPFAALRAAHQAAKDTVADNPGQPETIRDYWPACLQIGQEIADAKAARMARAARNDRDAVVQLAPTGRIAQIQFGCYDEDECRDFIPLHFLNLGDDPELGALRFADELQGTDQLPLLRMIELSAGSNMPSPF